MLQKSSFVLLLILLSHTLTAQINFEKSLYLEGSENYIEVPAIIFPQVGNDTIPNGSFEERDRSFYGRWAPIGWRFSWSAYGSYPITKSTLSYTGDYSVKGEVISNDFPPIIPNLVSTPPLAQHPGFSVSQQHPAVEGHFCFQPIDDDQLWISVKMIVDQFNEVGYGQISIDTTTSSYSLFVVPISYFSDDTPDFCVIKVRIAAGPVSNNVHKGSYFLLDELSFSETTSVMSNQNGESGPPDKCYLHQNYPNPFNPETVIRYTIPETDHVDLSIFNIAGEKILTLVNRRQNVGTHSITWNGRDNSGRQVSGGVYLCRLQAGRIKHTIRMLLMR